MRSSFFSLAALAQAVYVTETTYQTFFVTVDPNNQAAQPAAYSETASPYTEAPANSAVAASTPSPLPEESSPYSSWTYDWSYSEAPQSTARAPISSPEASSSKKSSKSAPTAAESTPIAAVPTAAESTSIAAVPTAAESTSIAAAFTAPQATSTKPALTTSSWGTTTSSAAPASTSSLSGLASDIVGYHNKVRALHHVGDVEWNSTLADYAASFLSTDNCVFQHSGGPYGENIAEGYNTIDLAQDAWYNEEDLYNYTAGQYSDDTGHFTQMVWKGTNQVGCATTDCSGQTFLVCEYYPRGNIIGEFTENVFAE